MDNATADVDLNTENIQGQLGDLLRGTAGEDADVADPEATNPVLMNVRVNEVVRSIFAADEDPLTGENRENLISLRSDETDLTEAEEIVASWEQDWQEAQERLDETQVQLGQAAEEAQDTLTWVMLLGAFALLVFAAVAGWVGTIGSRYRYPTVTTTRVN